jgi:hypothetical protein
MMLSKFSWSAISISASQHLICGSSGGGTDFFSAAATVDFV